MKRNVLNQFNGWMLAVASVMLLSLGACDKNEPGEEKPKNLPDIDVKIEGTIDHQKLVEGQKGSVTFNRFPATAQEFKEVREKIGKEPHGAVALQIMAYEMFRRNQRIGMECINLNSTNTNSGEKSSAVRQLRLLFNNDNSSRPYQMAAYLKGATFENGYSPTKPYTADKRKRKTRSGRFGKDQRPERIERRQIFYRKRVFQYLCACTRDSI